MYAWTSTHKTRQLMTMLSDDSHADVAAWLPHGKGFVIHDKHRFTVEIMPRFFGKQSKFRSFTRKLNRW